MSGAGGTSPSSRIGGRTTGLRGRVGLAARDGGIATGARCGRAGLEAAVLAGSEAEMAGRSVCRVTVGGGWLGAGGCAWPDVIGLGCAETTVFFAGERGLVLLAKGRSVLAGAEAGRFDFAGWEDFFRDFMLGTDDHAFDRGVPEGWCNSNAHTTMSNKPRSATEMCEAFTWLPDALWLWL